MFNPDWFGFNNIYRCIRVRVAFRIRNVRIRNVLRTFLSILTSSSSRRRFLSEDRRRQLRPGSDLAPVAVSSRACAAALSIACK